MNRPRTFGGQLGWARVLAALAAVAVIVVVAVVALGGSDEATGGPAGLQMQATARNTAHAEEPFAAEVDGAVGNRIEYSLAAVNSGKATLSDVTIAFAPPPVSGATLVAGSCRVRQPDADFVTCPDRLRERDLSAERLKAGEKLEVRVAYTLDSPPCRTTSVPAEATSDSAQTAITPSATATVKYTGLPGRLPRCGTKLAQLLSAVPAATRATCTEWPGLGPPVLARVQCAPKQGARYVVYLQYRSPAITAQVFEIITNREIGRSCGAFADGTGTVQDPGGKRVVQCSTARGVAHLTWYDDDASVFAYADAADTDRDGLLAWWRANG
jgi:hypothetical protein